MISEMTENLSDKRNYNKYVLKIKRTQAKQTSVIIINDK